MKLIEVFHDVSKINDYETPLRPVNDHVHSNNIDEILNTMQEFLDRGETLDTASREVGQSYDINPRTIKDWYLDSKDVPMYKTESTQLDESSVHVKVIDGDRFRYYWIRGKDEEKAKAEAIKKHKERMGYGMKVGSRFIPDKNLVAELVESEEINEHIRNMIEESKSEIDEVAPPGQEAFIKNSKKDFIAKYGQKNGMRYLYATAWRRHKGEIK